MIERLTTTIIARNINLVIPLAAILLLVLWGRQVLLFRSVTFVLFSIHSILLLPRPPLLHINTFGFSHTQLAFPLLPRSAGTRRAGTPVDDCTLSLAITAATATSVANASIAAASMIHEKGISGDSVEEKRSKLWFFLSAVLDGYQCGCGCERCIRGRRLGMKQK
jgi:hypothetical protein